ncbi:hypothetical protein [Chitinophaga filiformis]|uniref:Uncharacterized protein n=1 Tax=Chitinophaga filiformis TaxID=104663 RepID=A0ABY4HZY8_CHIFI|nr:hypothetical protein [Chitinophaga filiformis]UPK67996.1 hypothetical protein MYF79_23880 [Chitinophaga filiformis]
MSGTTSGKSRHKRSEKKKRLQKDASADEWHEKTNQIFALMKEVYDLKRRLDRYERLTAEMKQHPVKETFISRLFWPGSLGGLIYALKDLGESGMSWFRFTGILMAIPTLFVLLGVFVLYSSDSMKGESLYKLIKLSLRINLSGIKSLLNNKK